MLSTVAIDYLESIPDTPEVLGAVTVFSYLFGDTDGLGAFVLVYTIPSFKSNSYIADAFGSDLIVCFSLLSILSTLAMISS